MRLKNVLLVVDDIEQSKAFYQDLFGLRIVTDFGENVILTEGLVLQERKSFEHLIGRESCYGNCDAELYFEERDMDAFLKRLSCCTYEIHYLNSCAEQGGGKRVVRLFDPDGHVIEIGEPCE